MMLTSTGLPHFRKWLEEKIPYGQEKLAKGILIFESGKSDIYLKKSRGKLKYSNLTQLI